MVAFDENDLRAKHKYLVVVKERTKALFVEPRGSMRFDSEVVLESKILDEPYANENARRIAILKVLRDNCRKDINKLAKSITDEATGNKPKKNEAAVALGRLGGLKGGKARAAKLSAKQRKEIAKKAADARGGKKS